MENIYEVIGFIASFIVLVSLLFRSIKRLRFTNLVGSLIFTLYGFLISAYPVMLMNAGIVLINIYFLRQMYTSKDYFSVITFKKDETYVKTFVDFHKEDIEKFMTFEESLIEHSDFRFLVLRNTVPAGIMVFKALDKETLEVTLDYASPQYQDFKTGKHVYDYELDHFKNAGYKTIVAYTASASHSKYLTKMGFTQTTHHQKPAYVKQI